MPDNAPHNALRHYVTGAIERGEGETITAREDTMSMDTKLDAFTRAYIECALWAETATHSEDDGDDRSFEAHGYTVGDLAPGALAAIIEDCEAFQRDQGDTYADGWTDEQAGHDFWLTRNRHGAGFWDRGHGPVGSTLTAAAHAYGESDIYVGDDGKLYV